jgi:hypothetical protein
MEEKKAEVSHSIGKSGSRVRAYDHRVIESLGRQGRGNPREREREMSETTPTFYTGALRFALREELKPSTV